MRLNRTRHEAPFGSRFRPQLESLEDRTCLSVSVSTVMVGGVNELKITGDAGTDTVNIADQGNGSITVTDATGATLGTGTGIKIVAFDGMAGTDVVNYSLTGQLTNSEAINLKLGTGGGDMANVNLSAGLNANLALNVTGGPLNDSISATLGSLTSSKALVTINGGAGDDTITVTGTPMIGGTTTASLLGGTLGGLGGTLGGVGSGLAQRLNNLLNNLEKLVPRLTDPVNIDANSSLSLAIDGGAGNDSITTTLQGAFSGKLNLLTLGGMGSDTLTTNVTVDAGSTGSIAALSNGGAGTDNVTLNIMNNTMATLSALDAAIVDLTGADTLTSTANVKLITHLL